MAEITKMLRDDHKKVKDLFKRFQSSEDESEQREIATQVIHDLETHASIEREIVYPALEGEMEEDQLPLNEALEEHHVIDILIEELKGMKSSANGHFEAKFKVLSEYVSHHISEEESDLLPRLERSDVDLDDLAEQARERKEQLEAGDSRSGSRSGSRSQPGRQTMNRGTGSSRVSTSREASSTRGTGSTMHESGKRESGSTRDRERPRGERETTARAATREHAGGSESENRTRSTQRTTRSERSTSSGNSKTAGSRGRESRHQAANHATAASAAGRSSGGSRAQRSARSSSATTRKSSGRSRRARST